METLGKVASCSGLSRKSGYLYQLLFPTLSRNYQSGCLLYNHLSNLHSSRGKNGFSIQGIASPILYPSITDAGVKKKGKGWGEFVVVIDIINIRFALNTIKCIFLIFSYYNAIRFNKKQKLVVQQ